MKRLAMALALLGLCAGAATAQDWREHAQACEAIFALVDAEPDSDLKREALEAALDCTVDLYFTCAHDVGGGLNQRTCYEKSWALEERYFVALQAYPGWERPNWVLANECLAIVDELAAVKFIRKEYREERWEVVRRLEACKNKLVLPCNGIISGNSLNARGRTGELFDACMEPVHRVEERLAFVSDVSGNPMACFLVHGWRDDSHCPEFHFVEGFRVWLSPTLLEDPDFTDSFKEKILGVLRARLAVIGELISPHAFPGWADRLRKRKAPDRDLYPEPWYDDVGLEIFVESQNDKSSWDPCFLAGETSACADSWGNQIGLYVWKSSPESYGGLDFSITTDIRTLLHELAHAWHGGVVAGRSGNACIEDSYERNKSRYRNVEVFYGGLPPGRFDRVSDPYLTTNKAEYFAELSVLFFLGENWYPYHAAEFSRHDPEGYRVVVGAWQDPDGFCPGETPVSLGPSELVGAPFED